MTTSTTTIPVPVRTSRADHNFISCSEGIWQKYAGTDVAEPCAPLQSHGGRVDTATPGDWDAMLKVSHTTGLTLTGLEVAQGRENSLDLNNRCSDISLEGDWGWGDSGVGTGDQVITVKGGCQRIAISGAVFSRGKNAAVVIGAWSDQSHDCSTDLDFTGLRSAHADQPLTFILARCKRVKLPEGAKVLRWKSLGYSCYWWAKWCAVKVGLFR